MSDFQAEKGKQAVLLEQIKWIEGLGDEFAAYEADTAKEFDFAPDNGITENEFPADLIAQIFKLEKPVDK